MTPGVTITAADGSFTLTDKASPAPFDLSGECVLNATTDAVGAAEYYGGRRVIVSLPPELSAAADGQKELYGLLTICGVPENARGAAVHHYAVQVPAVRVEQTSGGRVSLVYEPFVGTVGTSHAWMLWLSRSELPPPPTTPPTTAMTPMSRYRMQTRQPEPTRTAGAQPAVATAPQAASPAAGPSAPTDTVETSDECRAAWANVLDRNTEHYFTSRPPSEHTPEREAQIREKAAQKAPSFLDSCNTFTPEKVMCLTVAQTFEALKDCENPQVQDF